MPSLYLGKIPIITGSLDQGWIRGVGDEAYGCIPRDYDEDPPQMGDSPDGIKLLTDAECVAYYEEQQATQSSLLHRFLEGDKPAFKNLDQNGQGYCWAYSTATAIMLDRLKRNLPHVRLSAHAVACKIMNFQDRGGWCGLSERFARGSDPKFPNLAGYPTVDVWPEKSMNRKYDTEATWANAALHVPSEDWYDLGKKEWDQELSKRQLKTLGLTDCPGMVDYNRYAHSMGFIGVVQFEKNAWGPVVLNSWPGWGYHGLAVLAEIWPDNACAIRSTTPSVN
jgi:hypothetical protein